MTSRKLIKLNKEGSLCVVLPKQLCQCLSWQQGMKINVWLGKGRTIIISEANDDKEEQQKE